MNLQKYCDFWWGLKKEETKFWNNKALQIKLHNTYPHGGSVHACEDSTFIG